MFLKKVFIFLAAAFLAVDIFLLTMYIHANYNLKILSDKMIDNTVRYYDSIGIDMDREMIVRKVPDNKIYTFYSDNSAVAMKSAENIAQKMFSGNPSVSAVETPEGPSYVISDKGVTVASLRVYTDTFAIRYIADGFSAENSGLSEEPFYNPNTDIASDTKKTVNAFIQAISNSEKTAYRINGSYTTSGRCSISVTMLIDDECPVDGMFLNLVVEKGWVLYAKGNIIMPEISKSYSEELFDGVNALSRVDADTVSEFVSENLMYTYKYAGNGVYYLIPVWKIEYVDVDGTPITQYIDAIKG